MSGDGAILDTKSNIYNLPNVKKSTHYFMINSEISRSIILTSDLLSFWLNYAANKSIMKFSVRYKYKRKIYKFHKID